MDLELLLLAFAMFWKRIRCYVCDPALDNPESGIPLCQYFDGSDAFVTDCSHSTVCFKKETSLVGLGDPAKSVKRGCAKQLMDGYQEKINGHWQHVDKIHEVYKEGCQQSSNEFGRLTETTECYCRGDLCNSSFRTSGMFWGVLCAVLVMVL